MRQTGEKKGRGSYSREFKQDAVRLVTDKSILAARIAGDLGIHENTVYKWLRQYKADPERAFPGKGCLKPQDEELRTLQRENAVLNEERDILKKALAIFSKHHG